MVEALVFGTPDREAIRAAVAAFCRAELSAAPADFLFEKTSVGVVCGIRLSDGRRVVVKAHQPRERRDRLEATSDVQARHDAAGFPCPRPLAGPAPIGRGLATAEELIDDGELRDTHDPRLRRAMAELLAEHLDIARECGRPPALAAGWTLLAGDDLWPPEAHSPIFDFAATASGAEWIDALATRAKPTRDELAGPPLPGHTDWSGEHFRFDDGGRITVVYDWDSVALVPEPLVIAVAAATFTANPPLGAPLAPTPDEMRAFLDDFPRAFSRAQRELIHAIATYVVAYIARCEHCLGEASDPGGFGAALREHGADYLRP